MDLLIRDRLFPEAGRKPYYIVVPRYVRTSAGIRALHLICHWLNMLGQSAYVLIHPSWDGLQVHPDLQTPVLDQSIIDFHFRNGLTPIMVYPEIFSGNPFKAPLVVRWLGNYPGLLGGDTTYDPSELCFSFSKALAAHTRNPDNVLTVPVIDTGNFRPTPIVPRMGSCFYAGKFQDVHGGKVFGLPPGCVEITRDRPDQLTPPEIAELFRRSEFFYAFEDTALITEAALCGCPVIMMPNPHFKKPLGLDEMGWDGYAWGTDPSEIERAKRTVANAYDNYMRVFPEFFRQLEYFVMVTQRRAELTSYSEKINLSEPVYDASMDGNAALRRALADAHREIERLRGAAEAPVFWEPALFASSAQVRPLAGLRAGAGGRVVLSANAASFLLSPEPDDAEIEIELKRDPVTSGAAIHIGVNGEMGPAVPFSPSGEARVRLPLSWEEGPLVVSLHVPEGHEGIGLVAMRKTAFAGPARIAAVDADHTKPLIIDLLSLARQAAPPVRCSLTSTAEGLVVESTDADPSIEFGNLISVAGLSRFVRLQGVYESDAEDELQIYVPGPDGGYSERHSFKMPILPGLDRFTLLLEMPGRLEHFRLDPLKGPGRIVFHQLELAALFRRPKPVPGRLLRPAGTA